MPHLSAGSCCSLHDNVWQGRSLTQVSRVLVTVQVHAYLAAPSGKTAYLSELKSGAEVLVVDPQGRQRTAVVGRIKVEQRPLVRCITTSGCNLLDDHACQSRDPPSCHPLSQHLSAEGTERLYSSTYASGHSFTCCLACCCPGIALLCPLSMTAPAESLCPASGCADFHNWSPADAD